MGLDTARCAGVDATTAAVARPGALRELRNNDGCNLAMSPNHHSTRRLEPSENPWFGGVLYPVVLVLVIVAAYANSFAGVFLFDDAIHILQNPRILADVEITSVLSGTRPVVDLTLALNRAVTFVTPASPLACSRTELGSSSRESSDGSSSKPFG